MEALGALAICATHISRLAEEMVLWSSPQFGFARMSDEWSTGSSIMPQKRNPDAAELIRAKTTRITAAHHAMLGMMKALPLTYSKDMQEDKILAFSAFDGFMLCVNAMTGMVETITFNRETLRAASMKGYSTATDLADWLVGKANVPFREAHHITGSIVKRAEELGIADLALVPLAEAQAVDKRISAEALALLTVEQSVQSRASYGGTAAARVREQVAAWKQRLGGEKA
jgi:argininosuccinate lyase